MRDKWTAPDLSNATPQMLIDEMGKLSIMEAWIKKQRGFYKEAFYARVGKKVQTQSGEVFIADTGYSAPTRLNEEQVKADHPEWQDPEKYPNWAKTTEVYTTRFSYIGTDEITQQRNKWIEDLRKELFE